MTTPLEQVILDAELDELLNRLWTFRDHVGENVPDEILRTPSGDYNVRNRYGAILFHISTLSSILNTFRETD